MVKNGRTWKQDCALVYRGLKEFERILPGQMRQIFIKGFFVAGMPFLTTGISAGLIDGLIGGGNLQMMLGACLAGLVSIFVLSILKAANDRKVEVGYQRLFTSHEIALTDKAYRLVYEELEKAGTRNLRDEVSGSISISGAGMASLYWDMEIIFSNTITVLIALAVLVRYYALLIRVDVYMHHSLKGSIVFIMLTLFFVAACSLITCKTSSKRFDAGFEVFQNGSKYISYGDFYTRDYLLDEDAALDARIYRPDHLILSECQAKCYERFAEGKEEEMHAVNLYDGIKLVSTCICGCAIYLMAGKKAAEGALGAGSILMMYAAVTMVIESVSRIVQMITDLRNNNEHLIKFFQYMDMPETEDEAGTDIDIEQTLHFEELEIRNVSFQYPDHDIYVLKNINLTIRKGDKLVIAGENGSGKSTLVKLICRLYQPTSGEILLNGQDIRAIPFGVYISCIAAVFQDFALFPCSLAENIAASREYNQQKVKDALEKSGLKAKADALEFGLEQCICSDFDENGIDLSGGEQQKTAIARAVYKDAECMVLDEPTAALDPYAEYEIYQNFGEITKCKTLISISHRLSSCRMCSRVVVMGEGSILQDGSHEGLLQDQNGKYYELWMAQAQYYS